MRVKKEFFLFRNFYSFLISMSFLILFSCQEKEEIQPDDQKNDSHLNPDLVYGEVSDIEGNKYKTIQIGSVTWMAENLRTTKFCNGDQIQNISDSNNWIQNVSSKLPAWVYYENDQSKNIPHGKLYNWYASNDSRNVCPCGWKVPTLQNWQLMVNNLGSNAGGKMKTSSDGFWNSPNTGASNESGFSGLPDGSRWVDGKFVLFGTVGGWWSRTPINPNVSEVVALINTSGDVDFGGTENGQGLPIRCIKAF